MVEFKGTGGRGGEGRGGEERKPRPDWSSCPVVSKLQDFTLNIRTEVRPGIKNSLVCLSNNGLHILLFMFCIQS